MLVALCIVMLIVRPMCNGTIIKFALLIAGGGRGRDEEEELAP